jgi:hypothetical protein
LSLGAVACVTGTANYLLGPAIATVTYGFEARPIITGPVPTILFLRL